MVHNIENNSTSWLPAHGNSLWTKPEAASCEQRPTGMCLQYLSFPHTRGGFTTEGRPKGAWGGHHALGGHHVCPPLASVLLCFLLLVTKHCPKTNSGRKAVLSFYNLGSLVGRSQGQSSSRNPVAETTAEPMRNAAYCLASLAHAQTRSLRRAGTAHSGLGPSASTQTCPQASLKEVSHRLRLPPLSKYIKFTPKLGHTPITAISRRTIVEIRSFVQMYCPAVWWGIGGHKPCDAVRIMLPSHQPVSPSSQRDRLWKPWRQLLKGPNSNSALLKRWFILFFNYY